MACVVSIVRAICTIEGCKKPKSAAPHIFFFFRSFILAFKTTDQMPGTEGGNNSFGGRWWLLAQTIHIMAVPCSGTSAAAADDDVVDNETRTPEDSRVKMTKNYHQSPLPFSGAILSLPLL